MTGASRSAHVFCVYEATACASSSVGLRGLIVQTGEHLWMNCSAQGGNFGSNPASDSTVALGFRPRGDSSVPYFFVGPYGSKTFFPHFLPPTKQAAANSAHKKPAYWAMVRKALMIKQRCRLPTPRTPVTLHPNPCPFHSTCLWNDQHVCGKCRSEKRSVLKECALSVLGI